MTKAERAAQMLSLVRIAARAEEVVQLYGGNADGRLGDAVDELSELLEAHNTKWGELESVDERAEDLDEDRFGGVENDVIDAGDPFLAPWTPDEDRPDN